MCYFISFLYRRCTRVVIMLFIFDVSCGSTGMDYCDRRRSPPPAPSNCPTCAGECGHIMVTSHSCSCDVNCITYGDCCTGFEGFCPTLFQKTLLSTTNRNQSNIKTKCKTFQWVNNTALAEYRTPLVHSCTGGQICPDVSDFTLNAYLALPVMDKQTGLHFINANCASCNSVKLAIPWNVMLHCENDTVPEVTLSGGRLKTSLSNSTCVVSIFPPGGRRPRICFPEVVSTCPRSCVNTELVKHCENSDTMYTGDWRSSTVYRNYYCALCWGRTPRCGFLPIPFTGEVRYFDPFSMSLVFDFDPSKGMWVGRGTHPEVLEPPPTEPTEIQTDIILSVSLNTSIRAVTEAQESSLYNALKPNLTKHISLVSAGLDNGNITLTSLHVAIRSNVSKGLDIRVWISLTLWLANSETPKADDILNSVQEKARQMIEDACLLVYANISRDDILIETLDSFLCEDRNGSGCSWNEHDLSDYRFINGTLISKLTNIVYAEADFYVSENVACVCTIQQDVLDSDTLDFELDGWSGLLTLILTILSILSLTCRLVMQFVFPYFDSMAGRLHFNLCLALCSAYVVQLLGGVLSNVGARTPCVITGVVMYILYLAVFCWMTAVAINTWLVLRPSSRFLRAEALSSSLLPYLCAAWLIPIILGPIVLSLDFTHISDEIKPHFGERLCWLNRRVALLLYFGIPVGLLLTANAVLFIHTACTIRKSLNSAVSTSSISVREQHRVKIYARLFLLMGLSWISGYVYTFTGIIALKVIFVISGSSYGVLLFVGFVCRKKIFKPVFHKTKTQEAATKLSILN